MPEQNNADIQPQQQLLVLLEQNATNTYFKFSVVDEPEVLHLVRSGHRDNKGNFLYFRFWEDAYGLNPWQDGITVCSIEEVAHLLKSYNIEHENFRA